MRDIKKFIPWLGDHKKLLLGVCTAFVCLNPSNTGGHSDFAGSGRMSLRRCFLGSGKRLFGICIGSVWAFLLARNLGQEFVIKVTGGKFYSKYCKYLLKENQFEKIFALLIFLPVAPDDFLCYLAGISKIPLKRFTLIIFWESRWQSCCTVWD